MKFPIARSDLSAWDSKLPVRDWLWPSRQRCHIWMQPSVLKEVSHLERWSAVKHTWLGLCITLRDFNHGCARSHFIWANQQKRTEPQSWCLLMYANPLCCLFSQAWHDFPAWVGRTGETDVLDLPGSLPLAAVVFAYLHVSSVLSCFKLADSLCQQRAMCPKPQSPPRSPCATALPHFGKPVHSNAQSPGGKYCTGSTSTKAMAQCRWWFIIKTKSWGHNF